MESLEMPCVVQKDEVKDRNSNNRISELPDEVLVKILSLLSTKEAVRTGVLSHRWKHLWLHGTRLDFTDKWMAQESTDRQTSMKAERFKFVGWVNCVLNLHQGSTIDDFRVCCHLNKRYSRYIDKWVKFAFSKKVKNLEMEFRPANRFVELPRTRYTFPDSLFMHVKSPFGAPCLHSLKSLCLKNVHVSGEILEYFLDNCPLLEKVHVVSSHHLENLRVAGPSLQLKYLHLDRCICCRSVEICAPNLVSFTYFGPRITLNLVEAPQLLDVSIGGPYDNPLCYVSYPFDYLATYLSQLETLTLHMPVFPEAMKLPHIMDLTNLRHLTCRVYDCDGRSLLSLTTLLEVSPILHKFTLEMIWGESRRQRRVKAAKRCPNLHIKEVELVGFRGYASDIEIALYFIESGIMLEKMVIKPLGPCSWTTMTTADEQFARKCAQQFATKLPHGCNLVIL